MDDFYFSFFIGIFAQNQKDVNKMAKRDYYDVLGVSKNASQDEIKKKYRQLSKSLHPDVNKSENAESEFKELNEAYSVLSDPEKKNMYDRFGTVDPQQAFGDGQGFDPFMGGFRGFGGFDPFMGGFNRSAKPKEKGDDLKIKIDMDLDEIYYGARKKVKINKKVCCHRCNGSGSESNDTGECPHCHGTGYVTLAERRGNMFMQNMTVCPHCHGTGTYIKDPCPNCHGSGLEDKQTEVEFDIPAGMFSDAYFVVRGKGNDGPHRGVPGDLLVIVNEKPNDKGLSRDEKNNLLYTLKLDYKDMVFGTDAEIPYIDRSRKIHIEPGTPSGKVLKLPRFGFPDPNNSSAKADYIITVECKIPKESDLTERQKKKIRDL